MPKSAQSDAPPAIWKRTERGFEPACQLSQSFFDKCKVGDIVELQGKKSRNLKHHQKYWVLLQIVVDNSDDFDTPEVLNYAIKASMGRGKWVKPEKASRPLFIPESISFKSMTQEEFEVFYKDAVNIILKYFVPHMDEKQLESLALNF